MAKSVNIGPFPVGMNTRAASFDLPEGACRLARNVVFTDSGLVRRRSGAARVATLTAPHSLFAGYYVVGGVLYYTPSLQAFAPQLVKVLANNDPLSYVRTDQGIFASNGVDALHLVGASARSWCPPAPVAPTLSAGVGSLTAGPYRVAISYNDATGREGPLSSVQQYPVVADGSSLVITHPVAPAGVTHVNIYASVAHGTALQHQGQQLASSPSLTLTSIALGRAPIGLEKAPLPAGTTLALHHGRLLSVQGALLHYSDPYTYGLTTPLKNFIAFPADITIVQPTDGGVWVVADQTYWLAGPDIAQGELLVKAPYGASRGTAFTVPENKDVGWYGDRGLILANAFGELKAVQETQLAALTAVTGAASVVEANGVRSVLVALTSPQASGRVGDDYTQVAQEQLRGL